MTSNVTPAIENSASTTPLTSEEQQKLILPSEPWSDREALNKIRADFSRAEQWRMQNYDRSLRRNDEVYYAITKTKTWEGTRIPRASIPVWMAVRHIQAIHAHWMQALFSDEIPFEAVPEPGTTWQAAMQVRDQMLSQLRHINPDVLGMTAREVYSRSTYSALTYGCGPIEVGWMMKDMKRSVFERKAIPLTVPMQHPVTGEIVQVPSGQLRWEVSRGEKTYQMSRPKIQNTPVHDFYFDPNCPSPNPQEGAFVCTRQLLPIWYLKDVCLPELGFNLPASDKEWLELTAKYKQTMAEISKSWGEVSRGNYWNPGQEQTTDLANQRVEVVRYWTNHRHGWLLGRDFLAYNQPNDLGIKPFTNNYYIPAPGRPYSISVCDILEGDQKLSQNLIEGRLDEVNIKLHPPMVRRLGVKISASQRKLRPGVEWEVPDDATKDVAILQMGEVLQSAYVETQAADFRAQQTTGASDSAAMGTGTMGGNSLNRTATGVSSQNSAFSSRVQALVENCEDQCFEPMLQMLFLCTKKYASPDVDPETGQDVGAVPMDVLNAEVKFTMKAATKLRIRRAAAGGAFSALLQVVPALQSELAQQGKTVNVELLGQLIGDSVGIPSGNFIVDMTPEQQQAYQQKMMAPLMAQQQLQDSRLQAMASMKEDSDEVKALTHLLGIIMKTPGVVEQLAKDKGEMAPMKLLEQKLAPKQIAGK